jgi:hypothetical protein
LHVHTNKLPIYRQHAFVVRDVQIRAAGINVKSVTSLQTPTERVGETGYLTIQTTVDMICSC